MEKVLKWASGIFAVIPGLVTILSSLGTPPGMSAVLYGGIVEAFGIATILLVYINKKQLQDISSVKLGRIVIFLFILFFISLVSYIFLFQNRVVFNETYEARIFFPLWSNELLQQIINSSGGRDAAITQYGPVAVRDAINKSPVSLELSRIIFLIIYVIIFEALTIAFSLLAIKADSKSIDGQANKNDTIT